MHCKICGRHPSEIEEYAEMVMSEGFPGILDAEQAVRQEEGTYNRETELFFCTDCYIKIGMPLGTA